MNSHLSINLTKYIFVYLVIFTIGCKSFQSDKEYINDLSNNKNIKVKIGQTEDNFIISSDEILDIKYNGKAYPSSSNVFYFQNNTLAPNSSLYISSPSGILTFNKTDYRGIIEIKKRDRASIAINHISLEQYLKSVVPAEMPPSWEMEALKAQAVAARTYALFNSMNKKFDDYDLESNTNSQVYKGIKSENKRSSEAVEETKGVILTYDERPIQAFFHSHSGGITESPESVWGFKSEYLKEIESDYCNLSKPLEWEISISKNELNQKLRKFQIGNIVSIKIDDTSTSGRVHKIQVSGDEGEKYITGNDFRTILGGARVKSLLFELEEMDSQYTIKGKGFGHGVGLSQHGANGMAKKGFDFTDILKYYYRGIEIEKLND
jgi:stage II sporulation protein D